MANNYLTYSLAVGFPNSELRDKALAYYNSGEFNLVARKLNGYSGDDLTDEDGPSIDFCCTADGDLELWICSNDEYGDVEATAEFLHWVSKKLLNGAHLGFQWAETCSKLRIGEHGGGAFWTDGKKGRWMNTGNFLRKGKVVNPS